MSSINNNPHTSSTTSSTTPTTRPVFDSNYLKSTYKFHQKALQRLSEVLFDDAKYLPQLMRDTDPIARLDYIDRNDPSLSNPIPRLRTPQSKQDDTMTLLWYLMENRSPMPTFQNKVHATCQICKTTKEVDSEWRICPMSHEVDIWRQWLLSLVLQMFPYSPSEWTEEMVAFLQQAVAGVASFVDASTGEFTGGSHHECIPKPIPGVDDIVTLMRKIHEWTTVPYTPRGTRGKADDGNEEKADDGNEEEEDEEDDSPTLELQHYNAYLAHLRVQASEAPTIDDCASRAYEHAIVMRRIPEYRNAMKSHHLSHTTSSPPTPQSQLLQMTSRQLIGQVSRSLLREWFVKHIGLTADGSDGYRLPQSARNFWFASPIVSTQDVVEELQRRVRLDRQLKREEQHRSTVRLVPYDDSPTPSSCASPPAHAPSQSCCAPRKPVRTRPRTRHIPEDTPPHTPDTPLVTESTAKTLSLDHLATIASKTAQMTTMTKMSKTTSSRKRGRPKGSIPHRANQTNSARRVKPRVKPRVEHGYYLRSSVKGDRK